MPGSLWLALALIAAVSEAPIPLTVRVVPAADPRGGPWRVQLFEESSEGRKPVDEHPVDVDGGWSSSAARHGVFYRLRIATEAGDGWYADDRPFEWDPERGPREVRLASSAFRATLVLGKKPLSGRVTFTDRDGLVSVPFASKTDGTFEGVLPRDGWWSVTVAADRPHFKTTFDVKVDPVFRDGTPPDVEIRVVSKVIQGEIVDLKNARVPVASLSVSGFQDPVKVEGGGFTWDRVVDGYMSLYAIANRQWSPRVTVKVSGGWVDPAFVALEVRPTHEFRGRVVQADGVPAPGARVFVAGSPPYLLGTESGADGRFRLTVRGREDDACLVVLDRTRAVRMARSPISESEQDVPLAESPGRLSLDFPAWGSDGRAAQFVQAGCRVSSNYFRIFGVATVPAGLRSAATFRAESGPYSLCSVPIEDLDDESPVEPSACVSGVLPPGGTLSLRLNP